MPEPPDRLAHYRRQFLRPGPEQGPGPDCPPMEQLAALALGTLHPLQGEPLARHARDCAWCAWQLRQLEAPTEPPRGGARLGLWIAAALLALAAALLALPRPAATPSAPASASP